MPLAVREAAIEPGVKSALHKLDASLAGTPPGVEGPLQAHLRALGGVQGLAFGAYGGVSLGIHTVLRRLSLVAAARKWKGMLCPSASHCAGILKVLPGRRLCICMARARSRLLHSRLGVQFSGGGPSAHHGAGYDARHEGRQRSARPGARP